MNFCKVLEVAILDLIAQGQYQFDQTNENQGHIVNTISVDKEVCIGLRRRHPRQTRNPITMKQGEVQIVLGDLESYTLCNVANFEEITMTYPRYEIEPLETSTLGANVEK